MGIKIDLTGLRFNRLIVIGETTKRKNSTSSLWLCLCECGKQVRASTTDLKSGHTKSCGCLSRENTIKRNIANRIHERGFYFSHEYYVWRSMRERCYNKNHIYYKYYGGRGITMYQEWVNNVDRFILDVGMSPSIKHTIDRIDNNGNYEPGNVRWATRKEQANNRSNTRLFEYNGSMKTISQLAEMSGIAYSTMKHRLMVGWNIERALTQGVHKNHPAKINN